MISATLYPSEIKQAATAFKEGRQLPAVLRYLSVDLNDVAAITGLTYRQVYHYINGAGLHRCPFWRDAFQVGRLWYVPLGVLWLYRDWIQGYVHE